MTATVWLLESVPFVWSAAVFVAISGRTGLGAIALGLGAASFFRRRHYSAPGAAEALLAVGCALAAFFAYALDTHTKGLGERPLPLLPLTVASSALWMTALRRFLRDPSGGRVGDVGLGLLVFLGCGSTTSGALYPLALLGYVLVAWGVLAVIDPCTPARAAYASRDRAAHPPPPTHAHAESQRSGLRLRPRPREAMAAIAILLISGTVIGATTTAIPIASDRFTSWAIKRWQARMRYRAAFADNAIQLGSLGGLLESEQMVMRVFGPRPDHLRGNVYTEYRVGQWIQNRPGDLSLWSSPGLEVEDPLVSQLGWLFGTDEAAPEAPLATEIEILDPRGNRFFLPLDASAIATDPELVLFDAFGVVRPRARRSAARVRFATGSAQFPPAPPTAQDLAVPAHLRPALEARVAEWTRNAVGPMERLDAIAARLESEYRYAVEFERSAAADPLLAFLETDRVGHCEYFASAMALLARTAGIPSRLVTGYRASEYNDWGGYTIVRHRNAHAWVEAFVLDPNAVAPAHAEATPHREREDSARPEAPLADTEPAGRWITIDATPGASFAPGSRRESEQLAGLIDASRVFAARHGYLLLLGALAAAFALLQVSRLVREPGRLPATGERRRAALPPELAGLLAALEAQGIERPPHECLAGYTDRVERLVGAENPHLRHLSVATDTDRARDAQGGTRLARLASALPLLERLTRSRYGYSDVDAASQLERDVARWLERRRSR